MYVLTEGQAEGWKITKLIGVLSNCALAPNSGTVLPRHYYDCFVIDLLLLSLLAIFVSRNMNDLA